MANRTGAERRRSLRTLARSTSGNTMALMGAAMIPLAAMTGSAIDMSRLYMVKVRLQQACDAGALAGRRFMEGTTLDDAAAAEANKFFEVNFPDGWMGATEVSFTPDETEDGQVTATATATVPMALMQMFGKDPVTLEAECDARFEISNTDIMFVLDVTGSMNCAAADTPATCSNNGGVEKSNSRIQAIREAVVDFYDTINTAVDDSARLRFGFVPYSSGVNVGKLVYAKNPTWIADSAPYQSRVANFNSQTYVGTPGSPIEVTVQIFESGASISQEDCEDYGQRQDFNNENGPDYDDGGANPQRVSGGPPPTQTIDYTYSNDPDAGDDWGYSGAPDTSGTYRSCRRTRIKHPTTYTTKYKAPNWTYRQETFDVSQYKTGASISLATGGLSGWSVSTQGSYNAQQLAAMGDPTITTSTFTWDGCIEERKTVAQATFSTIPGTAYDLDIDLIPNSADTRWKPSLVSMIYRRDTDAQQGPTTSNYWQPTAANTYYACPKEARKLATMTKTQVEAYVSKANGFVPIGGTYHDFGMLWGARFISPTGIFGDENATAPNGKPISRHIIFMTDGDMSPNSQIYGLYGIEMVDQRIGGTDNPSTSNLKSRHNSRFSAICNAARAKNITIWVIAYAQTMTDELEACADPGKAFYASNDDEVREQFRQIASQIAQLRLSR